MPMPIDSIFPKAHASDLPEIVEAINEARLAWNQGAFASAVDRLRYAASIAAIANASKSFEDRVTDSMPMDSFEANEMIASNRAVVLAKAVLALESLLSSTNVSDLPTLTSEPIAEEPFSEELESISVEPINSVSPTQQQNNSLNENYEAFPLSSNSETKMQEVAFIKATLHDEKKNVVPEYKNVRSNSPPPEPLPWSVLPTSHEGWPFMASSPMQNQEPQVSHAATEAIQKIESPAPLDLSELKTVTLRPPDDALASKSQNFNELSEPVVHSEAFIGQANTLNQTVESPVFQASVIANADHETESQTQNPTSKFPTKRPEPIASYRPKAQQNATYLYRARPSISRTNQRQWGESSPLSTNENVQLPTVVPPGLPETIEAKPSVRFSRIPTPRPVSSPMPAILLPRPAKAPSFEFSVEHEPVDVSQFGVFSNLAHATREWLTQTTRAISLSPGQSVNAVALVAIIQGSVGIYLAGHNDVLVTLGSSEVYLLTLDPSIAESLIIVGGYEGAKAILLNSSAVARIAKSSPWVIDQLTPGKDELQTYALRLLIADSNLPKKRMRAP